MKKSSGGVQFGAGGAAILGAESCPRNRLANPDMNREVYREAFRLNDTELDLIDGLVPQARC